MLLCVHKQIRVDMSLASATVSGRVYPQVTMSRRVHKETRVETSLSSAIAPGRDVYPQVTMSLRVHKEIRIDTSLASAIAPGRSYLQVTMSPCVHNVFAGQGYVIPLAYSVTCHTLCSTAGSVSVLAARDRSSLCWASEGAALV